MNIELDANNLVRGVTIVTSYICWITLDDFSRIDLSLEQLEGIVQEYQKAVKRNELLAQLNA